jgi:hypothetical protein
VKGGDPLPEAIARAYFIALSRLPTENEERDALAFLGEQARSYAETGDPKDAELLALGDFCQVLMSLNEFVYVE